MGFDEFTDFEVEVENERREREQAWALAGHAQDAADNNECLALAVDYLTTSRALQAAYAAKDTDSWAALSEHLDRVKFVMVNSFPSLLAHVLRGDYGR